MSRWEKNSHVSSTALQKRSKTFLCRVGAWAAALLRENGFGHLQTWWFLSTGWDSAPQGRRTLLWNTQDTASSGIPNVLDGMWPGLLHASEGSLWRNKARWTIRKGSLHGAPGNEDSASWRRIPRQRVTKAPREGWTLTEVQAPRKGPQTFELWGVAGVGLWLLFGQAEGEQPL